jgi:uncharacterized membrane protein
MRQQLTFHITALMLALGVATNLAGQIAFTPIDYPEPGTKATQAWGINPRGEIIGFYTSADGHDHGFLLSAGAYTSIDFPGASATYANAINARGDIVGSYVMAGVSHGFLLSGGVYTSTDFPGVGSSGSSEVLGINANGDLTGDYSLVNTIPCCAAGTHGFLLSRGAYTEIDFPGAAVILTYGSGINSRGDIVGSYSDGRGRAYILSGGNYVSLKDPSSTTTFMNALGVNARGDIVGRYVDANGRHGYLFSAGRYRTIDIPGATFTGVTAINSEGDIVGRYRDADGVFHGFLLSRHEEER